MKTLQNYENFVKKNTDTEKNIESTEIEKGKKDRDNPEPDEGNTI